MTANARITNRLPFLLQPAVIVFLLLLALLALLRSLRTHDLPPLPEKPQPSSAPAFSPDNVFSPLPGPPVETPFASPLLRELLEAQRLAQLEALKPPEPDPEPEGEAEAEPEPEPEAEPEPEVEPDPEPEPEPITLRLQYRGNMRRPGRPVLALVSEIDSGTEQFVSVGGKFGDFTLESIENEYIVLQKPGLRVRLTFGETTEVKMP